MPATTSNVIPFRREPSRAPDRVQDEALLRVIAGFEQRGREVVFEGEPSPLASGRYVERDAPSATAPHQNRLERDAVQGQATLDDPRSPNNFVSEYLTRPLRSEAEVRALRSPRIAPVASPLGPMWELLLKPWRPVS